MTKEREALDMIAKLQMVEQTMEAACKRIDELKAENKALKEALAQPEQAPVVVRDKDNVCYQYTYLPQHKQEPVACTSLCVECTKRGDWACAKAIPPQRPSRSDMTWVGLTDVEIASACKKNGGAEWWWRDIEEFARDIEAKLKEKNT